MKDALISVGLLAAGGVAIAAASGMYGKGSRTIHVSGVYPDLAVRIEFVPPKKYTHGRHDVWLPGLSRGIPLEDLSSLSPQQLEPFLRAPQVSQLFHAADPSKREWILQNGLRPSGTYGPFVWAATNPKTARRAMYLADGLRNVDIFTIDATGLKLLYEEPLARYWLYSAIAEQLPDVPPRDEEGEPLGSRAAYKSLWRQRALDVLDNAETNGYLLDSRRIEGVVAAGSVRLHELAFVEPDGRVDDSGYGERGRR